MVELIVTVDSVAVAKKLGLLAGQALLEALRGGLATALDLLASEVVITADQRGLRSRTGTLLNSVRGQMDEGDGLSGRVGVPADSPAAKYAWLLTGAKFVIRPVRAKYLAILIEQAVSAAGVANFGSPRDVPGLVFKRGEPARIPWGSGIFTGLTAGVMAGTRYQPLFALIRQSNARGRDVFATAIKTVFPDLVETVQERVDALAVNAK